MRCSLAVALASSALLARLLLAQDVAPLRFASLALGTARTCGVTTAGAAYCWGEAAREPALTPVLVAGGLTFSMVSVDLSFACGVTADGAAYCWGRNVAGILGKGTTAPTPIPIAPGVLFASVSVHDSHACGVTTSGAAYCWGENTGGELGTNDTIARTVPTAVVGTLTFKQVTVGEWHTCGLTVQGKAYCWGENSAGELGTATTETCGRTVLGSPRECSRTPVAVAGELTFSTITAGIAHTCGIATEGTAYCWGNNRYGQLGVGDNSVVTSASPRLVSGNLHLTSISGGAWHTCALTEEGHAYCWGQNDVGEVGVALSSKERRPVIVRQPVPVSGGVTFRSIAVGGRHACGITPDGGTYCWGGNFQGALGSGSREHSAVPVKVQATPVAAAAAPHALGEPAESLPVDSLLLGRALKAPPEDLAEGFLAVTYSLLAAQAAAGGVTVHTRLDGRAQTIDQSNASQFVALYGVRIKTYAAAIRQRGFAPMAGSYHATVSAACARLGFANGEATIAQHDFHVQLTNDSLSHRGVVVDSALVVEHAVDPDILLVGRATDARLVLEYKRSKCVLTLTRN